MKNKITPIVFGIFICVMSVMTHNIFAQDAPQAYPTRLILPNALWNYELPSVYEPPISIGPFDNYQISTTNGFMETDICVNPANPNNFVCTDNRLILGSGNYVYYTTNGGVT